MFQILFAVMGILQFFIRRLSFQQLYIINNQTIDRVEHSNTQV